MVWVTCYGDRVGWGGEEEKEENMLQTYVFNSEIGRTLRVNGIVIRVYNDNDRRSRPDYFCAFKTSAANVCSV